MKVIVNVDQWCIDNGFPICAGECPVALALARATGHDAQVTGSEAFVYNPKMVAYKLPRIAEDFVIRFDSGQQVEPFTFELEVL
jgi:hypothetical protein